MAPPSPSHSASDRYSQAAGDGPRKADKSRGQRLGGRIWAATSNGGGGGSGGDVVVVDDGHDHEGSYGDNGGGSSSGGSGGMGALFLRLQLTLPGSTAVVTNEDREASQALMTLLGETSHRGERGNGAGAGAASSGSAGGVSGGGGGGGGTGGGGGGAGREVDGAAVVGGGAVARLLGMPMGFRNTIRDVQDTIGTVLDTVEVSAGGGGEGYCFWIISRRITGTGAGSSHCRPAGGRSGEEGCL